MSTDYDLKCMTCGNSIETIASASISYGERLWTHPENLILLRDFLFAHCGHHLVFDDTQNLEYDEPKALNERSA